MRWLVLVVLLAVPLRRAVADSPSGNAAVERTRMAKAHFDVGLALFRSSRFSQAATEFEAGFQLQPMPLFLFNAGLAWRRAGNPEAALDAYRRFLDADPKAPLRLQVAQAITVLELEAKLSLRPPTPVAPPSGEAARVREDQRLQVILAAIQAQAPSRLTGWSPPSADPYWRRRNLAIGLGVGAAVVVLGAVGLALGLTLGTSPAPFTDSTIGVHAGTL